MFNTPMARIHHSRRLRAQRSTGNQFVTDATISAMRTEMEEIYAASKNEVVSKAAHVELDLL
jgi:hypothetical protein